MDMDDPEPETEGSCPSPDCGGEEERMMSHALEGLPEWRSPSRSSDWGRRSDVPRSQDEQDLVDAISKRTRAHYSLADMSLDQLETFLQESDEEDYFQNVDDEEEYRKFLAAVQEKVGPEEHQMVAMEEIPSRLILDFSEALAFLELICRVYGSLKQEKGIEESESEDEDADFEVEIEEALESDIEEGIDGIGRRRKRARRPVTRGKRRKRERMQTKVLHTGRAKAPLRPLLPYASGNVSVGERISSAKRHPSECGFTAHQIGQLYCLMHEHVQLLLQVYAMCILEPAMQQTAADTHRMLMELVEKREAILSWKISAFPDFCFRIPYIHPSIPEIEGPRLSSETPQVVRSGDGASSFCVSSSSGLHQSGVSTDSVVPLDSNSASTGTIYAASSDQFCGSYMNRDHATSSSPPPKVLPQSPHSRSCEVVDSPTLVNNLHSGSAIALTLHNSSGQTKSIDSDCGSESALSSSLAFSESLPLEWVPATSGSVRSLLDVAPLALVREFTAVVDQIVQASRQQDLSSVNRALDHSRAPLFALRLQSSESPKLACELVKAHCPTPKLKKTMAAALVESTKKQTIALVPENIAAAMNRFSPLFNKNLVPHEAPPASAANRLLFTDAEDELLAMGLMTYNNDWKAIQERFLPSKSMHQIFVRQKNRSSARAPHNSIKAVRRMKSSPLTTDEVACIEEALKVYKYDWIKVCRYCVPYRDPAVLPRQWRVAIGTHKLYNPIVNNREKRRLHDAHKRSGFAVASKICPSVGKVLSELHEAGSFGDGELENMQFRDGLLGLSCKSPAASHLSSEIPLTSYSVRSHGATSSSQGKINVQNQIDSPSPCSCTLGTQPKPSKPVYSKAPPTLTSLSKDDQTVQLAPGLPPLKLPPTVRVLSHSDTARLQISSVHSNAKAGSECSSHNFVLGPLAGQRKQMIIPTSVGQRK